MCWGSLFRGKQICSGARVRSKSNWYSSTKIILCIKRMKPKFLHCGIIFQSGFSLDWLAIIENNDILLLNSLLQRFLGITIIFPIKVFHVSVWVFSGCSGFPHNPKTSSRWIGDAKLPVCVCVWESQAVYWGGLKKDLETYSRKNHCKSKRMNWAV